MKTRRWKLEDVTNRNAKAPTFEIPSIRLRRSIRPSDLVKLVFVSTKASPFPFGERMWVVVDSVDGDRYRGRLSNRPVTTSVLRYGQRVTFGPENVAAIERHRGRDMSAYGRRRRARET